jgi:hypothetical protein
VPELGAQGLKEPLKDLAQINICFLDYSKLKYIVSVYNIKRVERLGRQPKFCALFRGLFYNFQFDPAPAVM